MAFGIFLVTVITLLEITKGSSSIPIPSSRYSHPFKYFDNAKGDDANNGGKRNLYSALIYPTAKRLNKAHSISYSVEYRNKGAKIAPRRGFFSKVAADDSNSPTNTNANTEMPFKFKIQ